MAGSGQTARWANEITTPLGLIPEGNNMFTVFCTGRLKPDPIYSESIGFVTLKLQRGGAGLHSLPKSNNAH